VQPRGDTRELGGDAEVGQGARRHRLARGKVVRPLASEGLELVLGCGARLDVVLEGTRVTRHRCLQRARQIECECKGASARTPPAILRTNGAWSRSEAKPSVLRWATMASTSRGTAAPAAYETVSTTETIRPGGSRPPPRWPPARGPRTHEDEPEAHPEYQPAGRRGLAAEAQPGEGDREELPHLRDQQPECEDEEEGQAEVAQEVGGEAQYESSEPPTRVNSEKLATMPPMMAKGRRRLPPPSRRQRSPGRRGSRKGDAGDQPADEADHEQ